MIVIKFFAGCALGALAGLASAADWRGPYVGLGVGGSSSRTQTSHSLSQPACASDPANCATQQGIVASFAPAMTKKSGSAGVQAGYNWASGSLVYGLEADANHFLLKGSSMSTGSFVSGGPGGTKQLASIDSVEGSWVATLRPRLGFNVADKLLIYATAGWAFSKVKFRNETTITAQSPAVGTGRYSSSASATNGWVAGFGAEYALSSTTSMRAEYQHLQFKLPTASGTNTSADVSDLTGSTVSAKARVKAEVFRIGFNWKF